MSWLPRKQSCPWICASCREMSLFKLGLIAANKTSAHGCFQSAVDRCGRRSSRTSKDAPEVNESMEARDVEATGLKWNIGYKAPRRNRRTYQACRLSLSAMSCNDKG